ncbi:putative toxin-antitoxin system toxin component, PIN family [Planktothricoides raciborskii]|uniref:Toxin-antitoxin system toxin component, PIN family n=1 Tax=Planktothricoides raciborskii GIHE-MW2 TaxID=2792601 RepID=A0AAU8JGF8_9CYAN
MTNRFVIDTNVLISALLFKSSVPFRAMELAERQGIILYSEATLKELERVLNRPKFDKYLERAEKEIFLQKFIAVSLLVNVTETIAVCRDEKDNKFLELAVSGHANIIITGDLDLLELNPFQSIEILTPDRFVDRLAR